MKRIIIFCLIFLRCNSVFSQQKDIEHQVKYFSSENLKIEKDENSFESRVTVYFGTSTLCEIMESTSPVNDLIEYRVKGIYRTELVYLILLSIEKKEKFKNLMSERLKGKSLEDISKKRNYDFLLNFERAFKISKSLEKEEEDIKMLNDILVNKKIYNEDEEK